MPANIEIKARVEDLEAVRRRAEALGASPAGVLHQHDVFFRAPSGRLKLRVLAPDRGELIHYHRPDGAGPKQSVYTIAPTGEPAALRSILEAVLEVVGEVRKERLLLLVGQTRVHLDRVEGLGEFVELEVVLRPGQATDEGVEIAHGLLDALRIDPERLVEGAYLDLLLAGGGGRG